MRYGLLSRFQGAFLGAVLGDLWRLPRTGADPISGSIPHAGSKMLAGATSLIQSGGIALEDWKQILTGIELEASTHCDRPLNAADSDLAVATVLTLPVMLFFHENALKLEQQLQQVLKTNPATLVARADALAVGYAIAQVLQEKLYPDRLIPQVLQFLEQAPLPAPEGSSALLMQQLRQVQTLLEQQAGLATATTQLLASSNAASRSVAIAFYCFLSTPEDFQLTIARAARIDGRSQITSMLTGALSGAYNSLAGLPVNGLISANHHADLAAVLKQHWGVSSIQEIKQLATYLLATWSGIYDPLNIANSTLAGSAVAAPQVMRPR